MAKSRTGAARRPSQWAEESADRATRAAPLLSPRGGGGADAGPLDPLPQMPGAQGQTGPDPDAQLKDFVSFVVQDVQGSWTTTFANAGKQYQPTKLVLLTGLRGPVAASAPRRLGRSTALDRRVYLDLGFFRELRSRFQAPGDFAQAYVIAHEFGHHVQTCSASWTKCRQAVRGLGGRRRPLDPARACRPLPRRRLGPLGVRGRSARKRGPRGRSRRRGGGRRRPPPGAGHGSQQPGELDARLIGAADEMVQEGLRQRRSERLRHVLWRV